MNIYFIPLVQLDHMVFVNDILLLRHTLLWTNDSHYKATPLICRKVEESSTLDRTLSDQQCIMYTRNTLIN